MPVPGKGGEELHVAQIGHRTVVIDGPRRRGQSADVGGAFAPVRRPGRAAATALR